MDEFWEDTIKDGIANLRKLRAGTHLRPADLALTIVVVAAFPQDAKVVIEDSGKQARWETVNGS